MERFTALEGSSCHQGQPFDDEGLGVEKCAHELSGKGEQRKLEGRVLRMGGKRKAWGRVRHVRGWGGGKLWIRV